MGNNHKKTSTAGIYRLPSGKYRARYKRADGGWGWVKGTFSRKQDARDAQTQASVDHERIASGLEDPLEIERRRSMAQPIQNAIDAFAADMLARKLSKSHRQEYIQKVHWINQEARISTLHDAAGSLTRIRKALEIIAAKHTNRTYNKYLAAYRAFMNFCVSDNRIAVNPIKNKIDTRSEEHAEVRPDRALTIEELGRLIHAAITVSKTARNRNHRHAAKVRALWYLVGSHTGIRWSEMARLTWKMVDLREGYWLLPASITKNAKWSELPINPTVIQDLRRWKPDNAGNDEKIFPFTPTRRVWLNDLEKAGIPYETPEGFARRDCLRSTYATILIESGVEVDVVSKLLRHSDIRLTMKRYAKVRLNRMGTAVNQIPQIPKPIQKDKPEPIDTEKQRKRA